MRDGAECLYYRVRMRDDGTMCGGVVTIEHGKLVPVVVFCECVCGYVDHDARWMRA